MSTTIPAMKKLAQRAKKQFPGSLIAIPDINCPAHLPRVQRDNIQLLNNSLATLRNITVIPELAAGKFKTISGDIHWTTITGNAMIAHWLSFLN